MSTIPKKQTRISIHRNHGVDEFAYEVEVYQDGRVVNGAETNHEDRAQQYAADFRRRYDRGTGWIAPCEQTNYAWLQAGYVEGF